MKLLVCFLLVVVTAALNNKQNYNENYSKLAEKIVSDRRGDHYKSISVENIDQESSQIDFNFKDLADNLKNVNSKEASNKDSEDLLDSSHFLKSIQSKLDLEDNLSKN